MWQIQKKWKQEKREERREKAKGSQQLTINHKGEYDQVKKATG